MVTLLSTTAFGGGSPSPISPIFSRSANPSPPHSPTRDVSPLTPGMPIKPWLNNSALSPTSTVSLDTPRLTPDVAQDSPLGITVPIIIPPRMDSFKRPAFLENDKHYQQTASIYIARPLPQPPAPGAFPPRSASIAKPWIDSTESQPVTPPRSTNNSPKYTLFPNNNSPGSARFPPTPPRSANAVSTPSAKRLQSASPARSRFAPSTAATPVDEARPKLREHRSHTEPHIQPPTADSSWQPRSTSLNRTQTEPVPHLAPSAFRPSISVPPTFRRPSAVEMIARKEVGATTMIKAGPGHVFQVSIASGPQIQEQTAVKWIKRSDKAKARSSPSRKERSVSPHSAVEERPALDARPTTLQAHAKAPQMVSTEDSEGLQVLTLEVPQLERPFDRSWSGFGTRGPQEQDRKPSLPDAGPNGGPTLERGRSLRRQNVPTPLALAEPEAAEIQILTPLPQWGLPPPSKGPLDVRASAFKPFSPDLDPSALTAFNAMKKHPSSSATSLALPTYQNFSQVNTTDKFSVEEPRKDSDARSVRTIEEITELIEAEEARWAEEQQKRATKRQQRHQEYLDRQRQKEAARKQEGDERQPRRQHRTQEVGIPPGAADFLEIKPLPPPPPAPVHLDAKQPVARSPSPLAKLASLVK